MSTGTPVNRAVMLYVTCPTAAEAERIGGALVDARLVACVNILPGMTALYRWQGVRQRDSEVVMIAKTRAALADTASSTIRATHPYTNPAIVVIDIAGGSADFLAWIAAETADPPG